MPRYAFDSLEVKRALATARIVKTEDDDFRMRFQGNRLILASSDKRRRAIGSVISLDTDAPDDYSSEEFAVSKEKRQLLEPDSQVMSITVGDDSIKIVAKGESNTKRASLKKRVDRKSNWSRVIKGLSHVADMDPRLLDRILSHVSCSALIKETKSEEDMRVNQVHFFPEENCAMAHARFYASLVISDGITAKMSIVSSDIPLLRAFCSKSKDGLVSISEDSARLGFSSVKDSHLFLSKVSSNRPKVSVPEDKFKYHVRIDTPLMHSSLNWVETAIEGTQRVTLEADEENGVMRFLEGTDELAVIPIEFVSGGSFRADFPSKVLGTVTSRLDAKTADFRFNHEDSPDLLQISQEDDSTVKNPIRVFHILHRMKERS